MRGEVKRRRSVSEQGKTQVGRLPINPRQHRKTGGIAEQRKLFIDGETTLH